MKKTNLLLTFLLLVTGVNVSAQPDLSDPRSARMVFSQGFEADWETFTTTEVDYIDQVQYYNRRGSGNVTNTDIFNGSPDWEIFGVRDTFISIKNGIVPTDNDLRAFQDDQYTIYDESSTERLQAFQEYGEDGGQKVFRYVSGKPVIQSDDAPWGVSASSTSGEYNSSTGITASYRRNLFVRLTPGDIEDNASYRLTMFVKATHLGDALPTFYADVMRGYFNSEKPFSMANSTNTFTYTKNDFSDNWEKITFMTYYTNDSIADGFVYKNGYWWGDDQWAWNVDEETELHYIKQPDKYFVRLSFASDDTEFMLDNLSLTKSTIGGVEYYQDKIRVNFGYATNLGQLAEAAYAVNKIAAVEIPGNYFEVWCLIPGGNPDVADDWVEMPIRSAEYHGDGYMYMFTDFYSYEGEDHPYLFDDYDKVVVSFHNPVDIPDLCLKYIGNLYPNSLDQDWIDAGKPVLDFINEEATLNPYAFLGVFSMNNLPPVMQKAPFEEGSFGLDPSIREMSFKFSRDVLVEQVAAYVGDETWNVAWDDNTTSIVITRPGGYVSALAGDMVIMLTNIQGTDTGLGEDVVLNYHFGTFERYPQIDVVSQSDWRSEILQEDAWNRPVPESLYVYDNNDGFFQGNGYDAGAKVGLYKMVDDGVNGNSLFMLASRSVNDFGRLYTQVELNPGNYTLSFPAFIWNSSSWSITYYPTVSVFIYPEPEEMSYEALSSAEKNLIGKASPSYRTQWSGYDDERTWNANVETFEILFNIPVEGNYVIEWVVPGSSSSSSDGVALGNFKVSTAGDLSFPYTNALNRALEAARQIVAVAEYDDWKYGGDALTELENIISYYEEDFTSTAPSEWTLAKNEVDYYTSSMESRISIVDNFVKYLSRASNALMEFINSNELAEYYSLNLSYNEYEAQDITTLSYQDMNDEEEILEEKITALEKRVALNDEFQEELNRGWDMYYEAKYPDYMEYTAMYRVLSTYSKFDQLSCTSSEMEAAIKTVKGAVNAYFASWVGVEAKTVRLKALYDLAMDFNVAIQGMDLYELVYNATDDDDALADLMKAAIKVAIYEQLTEGYYYEGIDLTPFIKNYNLYATPKVVDRLEYRMPTDANYLNYADPDGAQIQNVRHAYNQTDDGYAPIWIMILGQEYDDLLPGWSVSSVNTGSGNRMVTVDNRDYEFFKNDIPVFDGMLTLDWNSRANLSTVVTDLPVGNYSLGVELASVTNTVTFDAWTNNGTLTSTVSSTPETEILYLNDLYVGSSSDELGINLDMRSGSGFSVADNFSLFFYPSKDVDYANLISEAEAELDAALEAFGYVYDPLANVKATLNRKIDNAYEALEYAGDDIYSGEDYDNLVDAIAEAEEFVGDNEQDYYTEIGLLNDYINALNNRVYSVDNYLSYLYASQEALMEYEAYSDLIEYGVLDSLSNSLAEIEFQLVTTDGLDADAELLEDAMNDLYRAIQIAEEGLYEMTFDDITCSAGNELVIPVKLFNTGSITAFQFNVEVPYGLTFVKAELAQDRSNGHELSYNVIDQNEWGYNYGTVVSLACYSIDNNTLIGNDGPVVYLTYETKSEGKFGVGLYNIEMTQSPQIAFTQEDGYYGWVTVTTRIEPGDVNQDGNITITDAVGAIAFIIGSDVDGLCEEAADANLDGEIDAADVVWIVNKIIRKNLAPMRNGSVGNAQERYITSSISMNEVGVNANSNFSLPVVLEGMPYEITAVQFSLTLPETVELNGITTDKSHMVSYREQADGTYKVICLSLSNSTFQGNGESALTLQLTADSKFNSGEVLLTNAIMVTPDCFKVAQDPVTVRLSEGQTGIRGIGADNDAEMYDLQGRAIDKANGIYIRNGQKRVIVK